MPYKTARHMTVEQYHNKRALIDKAVGFECQSCGEIWTRPQADIHPFVVWCPDPECRGECKPVLPDISAEIEQSLEPEEQWEEEMAGNDE